MDDKGQMMVLEVIFFAVMVLLSLVFIYQLSPSSIVSNKYTNNLKIIGDDALHSLYNDAPTGDFPAGYPSSKLIHYLITNAYGSMISDLNNMLPPTVMYNIYITNITNETINMFWCNSFGNPSEALENIGAVTISHCITSIDPNFLLPIGDVMFRNSGSNDIYKYLNRPLEEDMDSTYDVRLEMWYI